MKENIKAGKKNSRKASAKDKKLDQALILIGLALTAVFFVISAVFVVMLHYVDLIPLKYKALVAIVLLLCTVLFVITQRWRVAGIITKLISVALSVILVMGCVYLGYTKGAIGKMSAGNVQVESVGVYVLSDDTAQSIDELDGYSCGKISGSDNGNTQEVVDYIENNTGITLDYVDYTNAANAVDAILAGDVQSIMVGSAYIDALSDMEGYEDIQDRLRSVFSLDVEYTVDEEVNEEYLHDNNVITLYVSGIDTEGSPSAVSRSDVNIIVSINTQTHQVLMINTPRDYYVPLSISNGVRDKLTHAGIYGINCSIDTLEMLYGVNIDYYVRLNFTGFRDIINALGGVTVYSSYSFTTTHGGYTIVAGDNYLNGDQALGFARERYAFSDGDRQRGRNQMAVISAIFSKMTTTAMLTNYIAILDSISDSMTTNMPYEEISALAKMQLDEMPSWDIQSYSVDGTGSYAVPYSLSSSAYVMVPDESTVAQAKEYLKQIYSDEIVSTGK